MHIRPEILAQLSVRVSSESGVKGRQLDGGTQKDFAATMRTMRETVDMAMADRFLQLSESDDSKNEEDSPWAGGLMNQVGLNLMSSLASMGLPAPTPSLSMARSAYGRQREAGLETTLGEGFESSRQRPDAGAQALGALSKRFESGAKGAEAIGYDRVGGTSYGTFQLSSAQGSLEDFLDFLSARAPDIANRLELAGPANTGSRNGAMPEAWRATAREHPQLFGQLQTDFIEQSHYRPALVAVAEATGLDMRDLPPALGEVLFSTAVQHGPRSAAGIFSSAMENVLGGLNGLSGTGQTQPLDTQALSQIIDRVYTIREGRFGSSTPQVQEAVANRLRSEKSLALAMLGGAPFSEFA